MLRKNPGFATAVVVTLALGIGANTAIFSLVNATLLQQLPVEDRDRLYLIRDTRGGSPTVSYPAYTSVRDGVTLSDSLVAWADITASLNADGDTDLVAGAIVTGHYFNTLGVRAAQGRLLSTTDDVTPGAHPVMVISDRLWRGRFGARADIVGLERPPQRPALHDCRRGACRFSRRRDRRVAGHLRADDDAGLDAPAARRLLR